MKHRCTQCRGKGGFSRATMRFVNWMPCPQCKGKGTWYTNHKPKPKKEK